MGINKEAQSQHPWEQELKRRIPLYGHRNWIVIADAAYPAQARLGIETIISGARHLDTVRRVLDDCATWSHIRPNIYTDLELDYVSEADAPGICGYRQQLQTIFDGAQISRLAHDQIIAMLDKAAQMFQVLIIKTGLLLPYTSVFVELDCAYWNAQAEQRVRNLMQAL